MSIPSATQIPATIFNDLADTKPYEKSLRTARIWLYVMAVLQAGIGIYEYNTPAPGIALFALLISAGVGPMFFRLALRSFQQPAVSFLTALIIYLLNYLGMGILETENLYKVFSLQYSL